MIQTLKQRIIGEQTKFSIHILMNGDIRLNIMSENIKTHIDMSEGQFYALEASINDATGQVYNQERGFMSQEFGDR